MSNRFARCTKRVCLKRQAPFFEIITAAHSHTEFDTYRRDSPCDLPKTNLLWDGLSAGMKAPWLGCRPEVCSSPNRDAIQPTSAIAMVGIWSSPWLRKPHPGKNHIPMTHRPMTARPRAHRSTVKSVPSHKQRMRPHSPHRELEPPAPPMTLAAANRPAPSPYKSAQAKKPPFRKPPRHLSA